MSCKGFYVFFLTGVFCFAQQTEEQATYTIDANLFYGTILLHNPSISHLITNHPTGVIVSLNRKTNGAKEWEALYNYPDFGYSFSFQNSHNTSLGKNYALYAHYNFYFFKRNMQVRTGTGIAYVTNPYDKETNFRNNAYGSDFLNSSYVMFNYHKENLYKGLGFKAGITLIHYSNGNTRAPNTSTNTMAFNAGLVYALDGGSAINYVPLEKTKLTEPVKFNLALRVGVNETDIINLGQHGFVIASAYADKRLGRKSAIQLGTDVFFSNFLKELIRYRSIAFPENAVSPDTDFKRVGLFLGHELFINKMSFISQLGYYVYYPFDFEGSVYSRIGLKRYVGNQFFGIISLKSHAAKAEAIEVGVGIRL